MYRILLVLVLAQICHAADWHLTPDGSGKKDGASWDHAFDQASLSRAVNEFMKPGDRLLLGGGLYKDATLKIGAGGIERKPKTIIGVDRGAGLPVFSSTWSIERPDKGPTAIWIDPGVSHVAIEKLRIQSYCFGIHATAAKDAPARSHLVFDDVDMERFHHGFYLSDCDDLRFTDCDLKRYSKHAFRFEQGCDRVALLQCTADCSEGDAVWENKTEVFPFGFTVNNGGTPNTAFVFEGCEARNNLKHNQTPRYKNGDGFVVEGNATDVFFLRCRSLRNQDGGFDLKARDVRLTDCVAIGNKRNFRIWSTGTLANCFGGGGETALWCNGGPVTATRCTFHAAKNATVMTDDDAKLPITLIDCIVALSDAPQSRAAEGKVVINGTVVTGPGRSEKDPDFLDQDPPWNGLGDSMNSGTYTTKGYRGPRSK